MLKNKTIKKLSAGLLALILLLGSVPATAWTNVSYQQEIIISCESEEADIEGETILPEEEENEEYDETSYIYEDTNINDYAENTEEEEDETSTEDEDMKEAEEDSEYSGNTYDTDVNCIEINENPCHETDECDEDDEYFYTQPLLTVFKPTVAVEPFNQVVVTNLLTLRAAMANPDIELVIIDSAAIFNVSDTIPVIGNKTLISGSAGTEFQSNAWVSIFSVGPGQSLTIGMANNPVANNITFDRTLMPGSLVEVNGGTFTMYGGTVRNMIWFPAVILRNNAVFNMHGGLITNNYSGVSLSGNSSFNMSGGTISYNLRMGVLLDNSVTHSNLNIGYVGGLDTSSQIFFQGNGTAHSLISGGLGGGRIQFPNIRWNDWQSNTNASTSAPLGYHLINNRDISIGNLAIGIPVTMLNYGENASINGVPANSHVAAVHNSTVIINPGTRRGYTLSHLTSSPAVNFIDNLSFIMPDTPVTLNAFWVQNPVASLINPTATAISYGNALSSSALSTEPRGVWTWAEPSIMPGVGTHNFNIVFTPSPAALANYNWTYVPGWNYNLQSVTRTISITVTRAFQSAPVVTGTVTDAGHVFTYTITPINGGEYSRDGINWQTGNVFTGFSLGQTVTFYARLRETLTHYPGEAGSITVTFTRVAGEIPEEDEQAPRRERDEDSIPGRIIYAFYNDDNVFILNSHIPLKIIVAMPFSQLRDIRVGGYYLSPEDFITQRSASRMEIRIEILPEFLDTLTPGTHRLEIVFSIGTLNTYFIAEEAGEARNTLIEALIRFLRNIAAVSGRE